MGSGTGCNSVASWGWGGIIAGMRNAEVTQKLPMVQGYGSSFHLSAQSKGRRAMGTLHAMNGHGLHCPAELTASHARTLAARLVELAELLDQFGRADAIVVKTGNREPGPEPNLMQQIVDHGTKKKGFWWWKR